MKLSSIPERMNALPASAKTGIIVAGYGAAIVIASCIVSIYISQTSGVDRQNYAAMFDFGDSLLFLAVFGMVSIIPSGFALIFLRQRPRFWVVSSLLALVIASTNVVVIALTVLATQGIALSASLNIWAALAFPRIFISPFLAATFGLSALIAPKSTFRLLLFVAASIEAISSVYGFLHWFAPLYFR